MPLQTELDKRIQLFNKTLYTYLQGGSPKQLYDAASHLPRGGGKRLRPGIAMLACEAISGNAHPVLPFAAALELVHNFTLAHDDIMDNARLRRNLPTVHMKYGEPTAILVGDFLFAKAFEAMHDLSVDSPVFQQLNYELIKCIQEICEGQQLDIEFEGRTIVTEQEYLEMIRKKTASLFRLSSRGGAIVAGGTPDEIDALTDYGLYLGLAFQIWDDYLDLSSDETTLGKDIGNDIRNGKKTLIAVHALENTTGENKQFLSDVFGNKNASEADVKKVLTLFQEEKSVDHAKTTAITYGTQAKKALDVIQNSPAKELLNELADYSIQREK
jgi:geranylgeranyl diphosphate synthase type I